MKGSINGLLALVSLILGALSFYQYRETGGAVWLVGIIVFLILMLVFGGMFLSGRVNKTEEIHITE